MCLILLEVLIYYSQLVSYAKIWTQKVVNNVNTLEIFLQLKIK